MAATKPAYNRTPPNPFVARIVLYAAEHSAPVSAIPKMSPGQEKFKYHSPQAPSAVTKPLSYEPAESCRVKSAEAPRGFVGINTRGIGLRNTGVKVEPN